MVANSCNFSEKLIAKINSFVRFYVTYTYLLHSMNIPELHPCLFLFSKTCISLIALTQQTFVLVRTYWRRLQEVLEDKKCFAEDVLKTSWRHFRKTYWKYVLKTSSRGLGRRKLLRWGRLEDVLKTSSRGLGRRKLLRWRRLEDVLKTSWKTRYVCWEVCGKKLFERRIILRQEPPYRNTRNILSPFKKIIVQTLSR